jgi:hypothetical protein
MLYQHSHWYYKGHKKADHKSKSGLDNIKPQHEQKVGRIKPHPHQKCKNPSTISYTTSGLEVNFMLSQSLIALKLFDYQHYDDLPNILLC